MWTCERGDGRIPVLVLKDQTQPQWTVVAGRPGVDISLVPDESDA